MAWQKDLSTPKGGNKNYDDKDNENKPFTPPTQVSRR